MEELEVVQRVTNLSEKGLRIERRNDVHPVWTFEGTLQYVEIGCRIEGNERAHGKNLMLGALAVKKSITLYEYSYG